MPEGDTIWRTARQLNDALAGAPLRSAELRVPRFATADLGGREVLETVPRGKHLLTRLSGGLTLHTHLGMDGSWRCHRPGARWNGGPAHQVRAVLTSSEQQAVGYRLPVVELLRTRDEHTVVGHLGPDLLGADWDQDEAWRRLSAVPDRPLGEALLDQRNLAGIGNVYRSELCFLVRLPPWAPLSAVSDPERLLRLAHRLLVLNRDRVRRATTDERRGDRPLWVYGRVRAPCLRCGTAIRAAEVGPPDRLRPVYWCPRCQPEPRTGA